MATPSWHVIVDVGVPGQSNPKLGGIEASPIQRPQFSEDSGSQDSKV